MHGVCIMGLATLADSLVALEHLVFETGMVDYDELMEALETDFRLAEPLRRLLENAAPKYGNDNPLVDAVAAQLVSWLSAECLRHRIAGGGRFVAAMASNVQNISAGRDVGATPDGRLAGTPLSDAASPYYGRDRNGPTAFLRSVATPDYRHVLTGSVVNMKFEPAHFAGDAGADRFATLTRFFVDSRIQELQFNFTGNDVLRAARENPEQHRDLVVRVSGFSAYYVDLNDDVQEDILRRRAHM
jgi:formate C-acetyltransferase